MKTLIIVGLNIVLAGLIVRRSYAMLADQAVSEKLGEFLYTLYVLFSAFAVYETYQIAVNGRYLSFSTVATYIPVFGLLGLMLIRTISERQWTLATMGLTSLLGDMSPKFYQNKIIGGLLLLVGVALIAGETNAFMMGHDLIVEQPIYADRLRVCLMFTLTNGQLLGWLASLVVLALPLLVGNGKK